MNLETKIDQRLWETIADSYQARNYTAAILDSMHVLGNIIREKTGLESDGVALIGQAFGGNRPKLTVNRFQTETEKSIQLGLEQILRGFYQAIRNPRSHEKYVDTIDDANAIVLFIDYLIKIIDKSKAAFSMATFLDKVFDPDFVEDTHYAELLVAEIPAKRRYGAFVEVFRRKGDGDGKKLKYSIEVLWRNLNDEEQADVRAMISEELQTTDDNATIILTIQIMPPEEWQTYDEAARMRIENKLMDSVRQGRYRRDKAKCTFGSLGTWIDTIAAYILAKTSLMRLIDGKLRIGERDHEDYVFTFLFQLLPSLAEKPSHSLSATINKGLENGDRRYYEALCLIMGPGRDEWTMPFKAAHDQFIEVEASPECEEDDDLPF